MKRMWTLIVLLSLNLFACKSPEAKAIQTEPIESKTLSESVAEKDESVATVVEELKESEEKTKTIPTKVEVKEEPKKTIKKIKEPEIF